MTWLHSIKILQKVLHGSVMSDVHTGVKEEHCGLIEIFVGVKSKPSAEFIIKALCPM